VNKHVDIGKNTTINATNQSVTFYIEEEQDAFEVGEGSDFTGNVFAERGKIKAEDAKANNRTTLTGQFIARKIQSDKYVTWNWNTTCDLSCQQITALCECSGGIKNLVVEYSEWDATSPESATLQFFADEFMVTPFATINNAQAGNHYNVSAASLPGGIFGSFVYARALENPDSIIIIPTGCSSDIVGSFFRELFVYSQTDNTNNVCEISSCRTGSTIMCHTPKNKPAHTHCVKEKDVDRKLTKADWATGPCVRSGDAQAQPAEQLERLADAQPELSAYPNPFTSATSISVMMPKDEFITLAIYNMTGKLVATLAEANVEAGKQYSYEFNAEDHAAGMYLYRIETKSGNKFTGKLMLIK
jgi:hypothetical protein